LTHLRISTLRKKKTLKIYDDKKNFITRYLYAAEYNTIDIVYIKNIKYINNQFNSGNTENTAWKPELYTNIFNSK